MPCDTLDGVSDEEPTKDAPRVVKRTVVKRTVVRPVSDIGREDRPAVRTPAGRPTPAKPGVPRTRTVTNPRTGRTITLGGTPASAGTGTPDAPAKAAKPAKPTKPAPVRARRSPRDVLDDWRLATSENLAAAGRRTRSGAGVVGAGVRAGGRTVLGLRLPHWPGLRGVLATAVVTGVVVVGLGAATLALFDLVFGVKSGGAWGVLAFAVISVVAFGMSRTLLRWFGHPAATVVAGLATLVGVVLLLVLLPTDAQSLWSLLIVPAVAVAAHLAGQLGVAIAAEEDRTPDDDPAADADERVSVR